MFLHAGITKLTSGFIAHNTLSRQLEAALVDGTPYAWFSGVLRGLVLPHATLVHHPRFFAYIPGPGSFAGAVGAWVAAATNLFVGTWLGGASMAQLELEVLDWLRQGLALPEGSRDAAMLVTVPAGSYTIQVTGAGTGTAAQGISAVEVYEADASASTLVNL